MQKQGGAKIISNAKITILSQLKGEFVQGCVEKSCQTELLSKSDYGRTDILVRSFKGQTRMSDLPPKFSYPIILSCKLTVHFPTWAPTSPPNSGD